MELREAMGEEKMEPASPQKTMYRISKWSSKIEPFQVVRTTAEFVFFLVNGWSGKPEERREKKVNEYHRFFETEAEALDHLIDRYTRDVDAYKRKTSEANSALGELLSRKRKMQPVEAPQAAPAAPTAKPEGTTHD